MWPSTVEICITSVLSYSLITGKAIDLEKASLIDMPYSWDCLLTLATNEKDPVLNRDNLTIPIQMQLSEKQIFFLIFCYIFKIRLHFEHFWK